MPDRIAADIDLATKVGVITTPRLTGKRRRMPVLVWIALSCAALLLAAVVEVMVS